MINIIDIIEKMSKEREEGLKTNPRYDIDKIANENHEVCIHFPSSNGYQAYLNGEAVVGSTERFLDTDLFYYVPKERIDRLSDGLTLAHIPAISKEQSNSRKIVIKKLVTNSYAFVEGAELIENEVWKDVVVGEPTNENGIRGFHADWLERVKQICNEKAIELIIQG